MAYWTLYLRDFAAMRFTSITDGTGTSGTVSYLLDVDQDTKWTPGSGSNRYCTIDLGSAQTVAAVALGNHNLSGTTITASSSSDGISYTSRISQAITTNNDLVLDNASTYAYRYWKFNVSTCSASSYLGSMCILGSKVELSGTLQPRFPIGWNTVTRNTRQEASNGRRVVQVCGGPSQQITLNLAYGADNNDTAEWGQIRALIGSLSGFPNGLWITPDSYAIGSAPTGYYCDMIGGAQAQIAGAGGRVMSSLNFVTLPKWVY